MSTGPASRLLLYGFIAAEQLLLTVCFLRFYRSSRERVFAFFASGFFVMAIHSVLLGLTWAGGAELEQQTAVFGIRLLSYALIFAGIVDKNLQRQSR